MTVPQKDVREAGDRVETILADLRVRADSQVADMAEELVSCLVRLYGAGLAAIMATIGDDTRLQALLIGDPLVEGLLLVHDLHPLDTEARVKRALGRLGPGAEFLGVDDEGKVHVKLASGCGSTVATVQQAVADVAPETTGVELAPRDPPLLQITRRPAEAR